MSKRKSNCHLGLGNGFAMGYQALPGKGNQTAFLPFDSSVNGSPSGTPAGTFVRSTGAIIPETGLWANENILLQSQTFGTTWTQTLLTSISSDAALAPDGTTTADGLISNSTSASHGVNQVVTSIVSVPHTFSVYVKPAGKTWCAIRTNDGASVYSYFNLSGAGSVGATPGHSAYSITQAANGFYRVSVTSTPSATSQTLYLYMAEADNDATYVGDTTTVELYVWGAQYQRGSTAGTYLPTTTAARYDSPRYTSSGKQLQALLLEESSTQITAYSNKLDTNPWFAAAGTNAVTSSGTNVYGDTAWLISLKSGTGAHGIYQSYTSTATAYTSQALVKAGTVSWVYITQDLGGAAKGAWFDLANGVKGTEDSGTTATITSLGSGWYRCTVSRTHGAGTSYLSIIPVTGNNVTQTFNAAGTETIYASNTMTENLPYATSYIPHTVNTGTVSRGIEYVSYSTTNIIAATGATIQGWWRPTKVGGTAVRTIWSSYTDASNWTSVEYVHGTGFRATKRVGGTSTTVTHATAAVANTWYLVTLLIKSDKTLDLFVNGTAGATNTTDGTGTPVVASTMQIGAINGTLGSTAYVDNFRFFNGINLTAAQALTYYNKGK